MLSRRQSIDILEGLDLDFLNVGEEMNMGKGFDEFFFEQQFENSDVTTEEGMKNDPANSRFNFGSRSASSLSFDNSFDNFRSLQVETAFGVRNRNDSLQESSSSAAHDVHSFDWMLDEGKFSPTDVVDMSAYEALAAQLQSDRSTGVKFTKVQYSSVFALF